MNQILGLEPVNLYVTRKSSYILKVANLLFIAMIAIAIASNKSTSRSALVFYI